MLKQAITKFNHSLRRLRCASQSGIAAIELAIILPVLMLILFGIINFGTVFYDYITITNAAREGARWGSINATCLPADAPCTCDQTTAAPNACVVAFNAAQGLLINYGSGALTTEATWGDPDANNPQIITVTARYNFEGSGFIFKTLFDQLSAESSMYLEQTPPAP